MGKRKGGGNSKRKNSKHGKDQGSNKLKRQKRCRKFWIESCKENKIPKIVPPGMVIPVIISRVELSDDHMHAGIPAVTKEEKDDNLATNQTTCINYEEISTPMTLTPPESSKGKIQVKELVKTDITENKEASGEDAKNTNSIDTGNDENDKKDNGQASQVTTIKDPFVQLIRSPSAKGKPKINSQEQVKELPNGDCGDGIVNPFPKDEVADKYWAQRKRLFSKFDEGLQLDKESWYSVTPEVIAEHIAKRVIKMFDKGKDEGKEKRGVILDAFCGVGGNAIGFANDHFKDSIATVICVDTVREKLRMAAHNASIYGIDPSRIVFIEGNAVEVLRRFSDGDLSASDCEPTLAPVQNETCKGFKIGGYDLLPSMIDVVFLSPPWGGTNYLEVGQSNYSLSTCISVNSSFGNEEMKCNGEELLSLSANAAKKKSVVYFLPRNVNGVNIGLSAWKAGYRSGFEIEQNCLNGKLKTVTTYLKET